jgi:hypothetical protein
VLQFGWGLILEISGRFQTFSSSTLKSWKLLQFQSAIESKYLKKFKKSQKPLLIGKQGVFIIQRLTVLKFFRALMKGTFKALLTIGGK